MAVILIVEDDTTLRETLSSTLRTHGYEVQALPDARGLLEKTFELAPDLLLLDVMLPGLDGLTACRALRAAGSKVPVLMLSARSNDMDKIVGLETGADDYATKPFSTGELIARVRALLRRSQSEQRSVLDAGDLQMDLIARRAQLRGEELRLTHKEFDLLAELIRNKGMVLSRDLLLEKIWGYDFLGDSRTVDVHIRWLRQKIELEPSLPVRIVTVRGIGYRFDG
jgi:DNA-binding response OmpR family regulator